MIGQKEVPSRVGGIEVAVEALAVRMAAQGHKVTLYNCSRYSLRKKEKRTKYKQYKGVIIREVKVPNVKGISAALGSALGTFRAVFGKYDCIHYHAEGSAVMSFVPHLLGIRTVVTIHGLDWQRSKWGTFAAWYLKLGEKISVACADEIIVLSRATQKYFQENYFRSTVMIPNGIEQPVERSVNMIEKKWKLEKNGYILFVGRIVPEKGIENLIRAFQRISTKKKLVIAGGISDTKRFYKKLKKIAWTDPRIVFTDFVQDEVLAELYSNCYFYCLPSELEGMPISLLEAMSYGNCCLCADIPECVEVVGERGILFKKGDAEDLEAHLRILCEKPELVVESRRRMSGFVFEENNWDKITEETLALYRSKSTE